jgi:very-short-patch-repair endonuclease
LNRFVERARSLRARQTSSEALLWRALRGRRLARHKFRRQHAILSYVADFACLDARLVVEIDGDTHFTDHGKRRDAVRTQAIEAAGFHILRVTNQDVRSNMDGVIETILAEIDLRAGP